MIIAISVGSVILVVVFTILLVIKKKYRNQKKMTKTDYVTSDQNTDTKLKRKPGAWDEDYDYDDLNQQRKVRIRPGVHKEYLNDATYYLKFASWAKKDENGDGSNNQDEDYYKDNYQEEGDYYKDNVD